MTESKSISVVESAMTNCQNEGVWIVRWDTAGSRRKEEVRDGIGG